MNIIFITCENLAGNYGVGTYVKSLVKKLSTREGIKVSVIEVFYTKKLEVTLHEEKGVNYLYIPRPVSRTHITDLNDGEKESYRKKVVHIINQHTTVDRASIIHVNYHPLFFLAAAIRVHFNIPVISTIHVITWKLLFDLFPEKFKKAFHPEFQIAGKKNLSLVKSNAEGEAMEQSNKLIFVTKYAAEFLGRVYDVPDTKYKIIYNGISLNKGAIRGGTLQSVIKARLGFKPDDQIIIFCGRLTSSKGVFHLINAFKRLLVRFSRAKLVLIGEGDFSEIFKHAESIWSSIVVTGYLKKDTIYQFYQIADIGVIPSLHEQCSYVAIEMMMHRVPIVVSSTDGLNEMFEDGRNALKVGFYYDKQSGIKISEDELVEKISVLLSDKSLAMKIGEAARINAKKRFSVNKMIQETIMAYEETIADFASSSLVIPPSS